MNEPKSRQEHLDWCKAHALQQLEYGDPSEAFASMASEMEKHPETRGHPALQLGMMMLLGGLLNDAGKMKAFIEGFN